MAQSPCLGKRLALSKECVHQKFSELITYDVTKGVLLQLWSDKGFVSSGTSVPQFPPLAY